MIQPTSANIQLHYQKATRVTRQLPSLVKIKQWVAVALAHNHSSTNTEIAIRFVDNAESAKLNFKYRKKRGATNILTFPFSDNRTTGGVIQPLPTLSGDLVICIPLVIKEARQQKLPFTAHLAHLIIHGVLHLLGYTHTQEKCAAIMEKQETTILKKLGYDDPYL